jgi:L-aminopeptidase/D-esterase-like protein
MEHSAETGAAQLPPGVSVGHYTDQAGRTGCTVILIPGSAVAGVDVRGAAPGTLGTDALRPGTVIERGHALLLTGGSLFGLAAAAGVVRYLEESGVGSPFGSLSIPGVAAAVIFDLVVGDPNARPDAEAGYAACEAATRTPGVGAVGVGTGATVAKGGDRANTRAGGVGLASAKAGDATVTAVVVANSVGGIWDDERHEWVTPPINWDRASSLIGGTNTTLGAVLTDARLNKEQANRVATVAHDGIARAVRPAHTMYDGDAIFCMATGATDAPYDVVEVLASELVARAIAAGVRAAAQ